MGKVDEVDEADKVGKADEVGKAVGGAVGAKSVVGAGAGKSADKSSDKSAEEVLSVQGIEVVYDRVILALRGVSLRANRGDIVALLGANGAGKSTTLKAISRLLSSERGEIRRGSVHYEGQSTDGLTPADLVRRGVIQVMEGRRCFGHLTVEENLLTGASARRASRAALAEQMEKTYHYFPRLRDRRTAQAGYVSGGEQQMVAIGRALMANPRLILLDEPSMGLAPQLVDEIFSIVVRLNREEGITALLAEQNAVMALRYANHGYVLENGRVTLEGSGEALRGNDAIRRFYLGLGDEDEAKRSFRDPRRRARVGSWLS